MSAGITIKLVRLAVRWALALLTDPRLVDTVRKQTHGVNMKRTRLGILHALCVQTEAMRISAAMYDVGHLNEAVRMANAMFILLGPNMRNHKSILQQLGEIETTSILSSADSRGPHGSALIAAQFTPYVLEGGQSGWIAKAVPFGQEPLTGGRRLSVSDWWNEGVLRGPGSETHLSRLQVVRIIRDQDGGAHFDDHLKDDAYLSVYLKGIGIFYKPSAESEESRPVEGAIQATIRQMAHELMDILPGKAFAASMALAQASQKAPLITQLFEIE